MRKILSLKTLVLLSLLFSGQHLWAQTAPTTLEEYNMGSVGYRTYLQLGVELKKGYKVNPLTTYEYGERKAEFKGLYRPAETKPCAIILVYSRPRANPEYYCIPSPDSDELLWDLFRKSLAGETDSKQEQLQFFSAALGHGMMYFAQK